jgi:hypothetical protein
MPISIPADLTIVTLRANGVDQEQRFTERYAATLLQLASTLWTAYADVAFQRASCNTVIEELPPNMRTDVVDDSGYHFLVARHRAGAGVRVLFVNNTARPELGGQARHEKRVCMIRYLANADQAARILAHELGHLLELPHIDDPNVQGPGTESIRSTWMRNLMFSGSLVPDAEISDDQRAAARSSALAQRFSSGGG